MELRPIVCTIRHTPPFKVVPAVRTRWQRARLMDNSLWRVFGLTSRHAGADTAIWIQRSQKPDAPLSYAIAPRGRVVGSDRSEFGCGEKALDRSVLATRAGYVCRVYVVGQTGFLS